MTKLLSILLTIAALTAAGADQPNSLSQKQVEIIREAIWKAEGGAKAQYAYGIKSVAYHSLDEARQICENSIRNNYSRWIASGMTNDFIPFMAIQYCPLDSQNWTKNVEFFYKHP